MRVVNQLTNLDSMTASITFTCVGVECELLIGNYCSKCCYYVLFVVVHLLVVLLILARGDVVHPLLIFQVPANSLLNALLELQ